MDFESLSKQLAVYVGDFNANDADAGKEKRDIPNGDVLEWMRSNIPLVDFPDKVMERAYYFRWWSFRKHIRKTPDGYVITEFLADVPWAGKHNTINCAAGHHFNEGRWIKNTEYLEQYLSFWFEGGGSIRSYSFWVADSAYRQYLVSGNINPLMRYFSDFINNYKAWEESHGEDNGLFWQVDDREGMELSMAGAGLRPTVNSYMYAEAKAIAAIARLLGEESQTELFEAKAARIKEQMLALLWDTEMKFFKTYVTEKHREIQKKKYAHHSDRENTYVDQPLGLHPVPELFGYAPWCYGVMDDVPAGDYLKAWRYITDPDYFAGPVGLATAPMSHPHFIRHHRHECAWDGPTWPYATCQALGAMARMLRNDAKSEAPVTARDYMKLMNQYAAMHRLPLSKGAEPVDWIDENYDPRSGALLARDRLYEWNDANKDRGQYYNHSTFCDLVISDVIGLSCDENGQITVQPLAVDWPYFLLSGVSMRGSEIAVMYDRDGTRYGKGSGLAVFRDGQEVGRLKELGRLTIS